MSDDNSEQPLREVVAGQLRSMILGGELKPGQRLVEGQLAERLGVSRNPVREAMRSLEATGLIDAEHRRERGREIRYGRRGSLSVDLPSGQWRDHEAGSGGGVLALVERCIGGDRTRALDWLADRGLIERRRSPERPQKRRSRPPAWVAPTESGHVDAAHRALSARYDEAPAQRWALPEAVTEE